jgi:antitoxin ParD1/3/4
MATMTVSLPDPMKDWIESLTRLGEYASSSDYVRDLVRRDRERRGQELTLGELRQLVTDAKDSGVSTRSVQDIFEEARKIVRARNGG